MAAPSPQVPDRPVQQRPGLQAERTDLAWERSALTLLANGGLLLVRHDLSAPEVLQVVGGGAALVLALFTLGVARRRRRTLASRPLPQQLAGSTSVLLLACGTALLGLITLAVLLTP